MADKTARKRILLRLESDAAKAASQFQQLQKQMREAKFAAQEAKAAGDQYKLSLIAKNRELAAAAEASKKAARAAKEFKQRLNAQKEAMEEAQRATTQYKDAIKNLKGMFKSFTDVKSVFDLVMGSVKKLFGAIDELITSGNEYRRMKKAQTTDIKEASRQTAGYVTQVELLKAANKAAAFGLNFSSKQFATLARGAVVASQKIGGDMVKAVDDLITGMGRGSRPILDNLGIMVSVGKANEAMARKLGKSTAALTDQEKQTAFVNATLRELSRLSGNAELKVETLGDRYDVLKNRLSDLKTELGYTISRSNLFVSAMKKMATATRSMIEAIKLLGETGRDEQAQYVEKRKRFLEDLKSLGYAPGWIPSKIPQTEEQWRQAEKRGIGPVKTGGGDFSMNTEKRKLELAREVYRNLLKFDQQFSKRRLAREDRANREAAQNAFKQHMHMLSMIEKASRDSEKKTKRQGKDKGKRDNTDLYTAHIDRYKQELKYQKMTAKADNAWRQEKLRQETRLAKDLDRVRKNQHRAYLRRLKKQRKEEKKRFEEWKRNTIALSETVISTMLADITSAKSASEALSNLAKSGLNAIRDYAVGKAAAEVAEALGAQGLTWGVPNPASINHWASAAAWAVIAGGAAFGSASLGSSSSGGYSATAGVPGSSVSSGNLSTSDSDSSVSAAARGSGDNITNIYLKGRSGLVTRKDLKRFATRMNSGRAT